LAISDVGGEEENCWENNDLHILVKFGIQVG